MLNAGRRKQAHQLRRAHCKRKRGAGEEVFPMTVFVNGDKTDPQRRIATRIQRQAGLKDSRGMAPREGITQFEEVALLSYKARGGTPPGDQLAKFGNGNVGEP